MRRERLAPTWAGLLAGSTVGRAGALVIFLLLVCCSSPDLRARRHPFALRPGTGDSVQTWPRVYDSNQARAYVWPDGEVDVVCAVWCFTNPPIAGVAYQTKAIYVGGGDTLGLVWASAPDSAGACVVTLNDSEATIDASLGLSRIPYGDGTATGEAAVTMTRQP